VCPSCSKKYGGYYEAVLQIRREGRFLTKEEKNLFLSEVTRLSEAELESYNMAFITQVLPKKEGIDFQMGSLKVTKKIARALQSAYGGTIAESHRLAGFDRQAGKERYRTTVVLRLSVFEAGLFVLYDGRLWKVADALDKLLLRNFSEERAIDFKKVEKEHASGALEIIDKKALRPGMIASRDAEGAELLTLDSYETLPLAPELVVSGMDQGEQVLFFTRDGTHYAVSP
jgi:nonsense-mediated mRNA decay protein 3